MQAKLQHIEALVNGGSYERARAELLKLVAREPRNPSVLNALAIVHGNLGELAKGLYYIESATVHAPANPVVWRTYANLLGQSGKLEKAAAAFDRIIEMAPSDAGSWLGRASIERFRENLAGAVELLQRGIVAAGEREVLLEALVAALSNSGNPERAMERCRDALRKFPDSIALAALACNTSHNVVSFSPAEIFQLHRDYGRMMSRCFPPPNVPYRHRRDPSKRLRIGVVSSDLRRHSVAFFIEPLLQCIDRTEFDVWVYFTSRESDAVTERLKALVSVWKDVASLADPQLAGTVDADQIDILLDLQGHTQGHRMGLFHNKPSPVQMTYLGYPDTTGLAAMDYRIVDEITDPPAADALSTEKLLRLKRCFLCYTPPRDADCPAITGRQERPVTFGCFNALHKLSDYSIGLWSAALHAVPGSRMIIKCPVGSQKMVSDRILGRFASRGIDVARIQVLPALKTLREHLDAYQLIDIALDPFPYHGTTTTCEALFMGVPVVTLAGVTHIQRVGPSILASVGHTEWVARSSDEYTAIAAKLAESVAAAPRDREALRAQLLTSPLCDATDFARQFSVALRQAWTAWCTSAGAAL